MKKMFNAAGAVLAVLIIFSVIGYVAGKPTTLADSVGVGVHQSMDFLKNALSSAQSNPAKPSKP
jgi:hypothetical protein